MNKRLMLILVMVLLGLVLVSKISDYQAECYNDDPIVTDHLETTDDKYCGQSYMLVNAGQSDIHVSGISDHSKNTLIESNVEFTLEPGEMYPLNGDGIIDYQFDQEVSVQSTIITNVDEDLIVITSEI
ncbi:hypothetical protein RZE82_05400 [Mollicutes bacterium LVI A0039]|nr:hypothetical protein RZE82_05400 [Mollicutes bacterium LVI A0039]